MCPVCGNHRTDRFCPRCGAVVPNGGVGAWSPPPPIRLIPPPSPVRRQAGGLLALFALLIFGGLFLNSLSRKSNPISDYPSPPPVEFRPALPDLDTNPAVDIQRSMRTIEGQSGTAFLEIRISELQARLEQLGPQRAEVAGWRGQVDTAMAFGQTNWPSSGRPATRGQLQAALGRADRWLSEADRILVDARDRLSKMNIARGQAQKIQLAVVRAQADLDASLSRNDGSQDDARHRLDQQLNDLSRIVREPGLQTALPQFPPFEREN